MKKDVVIIGGGIGGLMSGCLLCKEGYRPIIIEQHYKVGGGLHCFSRKGAIFESGMHFVSGFEETGPLRKIFSYLGIMDKIHVQPLDKNRFELVHFGSDNLKVTFGVGKDNFIEILSKQFPHEADNIRNLMDALYRICDQIPLFNLRTSSNQWYLNDETLTPVNVFIEKYIQDKKLQIILAWNNTLYSGSKDETPIYIHAIITKFYVEGASRFVNGSQHVADEMVKMIEAHGGKVILKKEITKIEIEDSNITKVIAADGSEYTGDYYISNIHPAYLMDIIDPANIQKAYRERLQNLENSYSAFIMYIVFKPQSFPYMNYNYFYYKDYNLVWNAINYDLKDFPQGFMAMTSPETFQNEYAKKGMFTCIMRYNDFKEWENTVVGKRGKEYVKLKKEIETRFINLVEEVFPNFKNSIDKVICSTPLTIRDYLKSKEGGLYGYKKNSQNLIKSQVLARTKIKNLFLTGQNINLHGILGVPLSAIVTVGELVGGFDYLVNKINDKQ
ncbi:MAG: NAD(P)/FAD-dependent oxidoreductase [Bacteroidales bacterium]|nr:NAD(P)/FAD-dependent oxidoreductase [Bacteroidales bacterium]MDD4210306.1 NAD(P)/FAD-dependent oxidoreductase [Bacteroidales bacterium]